MKTITNTFLIIALTFLLACGLKGIGIPEDKKDYVGTWRSEIIELRINENGRVEYKKSKNGMSSSVNGPIQKYDGNSFIVGALGINTTFIVSEAPKEVNGVWKMTVDGNELTKD
jgi:predicted amidohydrolase